MDFFDNTDNITGLHTDECGGRQLDFGTCDKRGTGRWGFPEAVCPVCCPYGWGYRQMCIRDRVYDGTFTGTLTQGDGVCAACLKEHGIRVYGESQVGRLLEDLER